MKEQSAQATTVRDLGLLVTAGSALLIGTVLILASHVFAQSLPTITVGPTVAESSITETTATVSWTVDPASTGQVEFGETEALGRTFRNIVVPEETEVVGTSHSIWLFELRPGTTYYYRVRSTDGAGASAVSEIRSFTTMVPSESEPEEAVEDEPEDVSDAADDDTPGSNVDVSDDDASDVAEREADAIADDVADGASSGSDDGSSGAAEEEDEDAAKERTEQEAGSEDIGEELAEEKEQEEGADGRIPELSEDETRIMFASDDGLFDEVSVGIHMFGEDEDGDEPRALSPELLQDIADFVREIGDDSNGALLSGTMGSTDVRAYGAGLCAQNFIKPASCVSWLIGEFADSSCRDAGLLTKGACERFLIERNGGAFPGCETLDASECDEHKALVTIDLMSDDLLEGVDRIIEQAGEEQTLVVLPHMTSLRPEHVGRARWWKSPRAPGQQTATGMIVLDTDLDGLPDDYEASLGTDPLLADSDEDGIDDIIELQRDLDPSGSGSLGRELRDSERTIVFRQPLEQPAAMSEADPSLSLGVNEAADGLQGACEPGQTCFLYFYSYVPMVLTTTADEAGNWQYDLSDAMTDGHHIVYVAVTDDTGKIVKRSNPLSFFVNEAKAVTFDDFVAASVEPLAAVGQGTPEEALSKYVYGAIALVFVAVLLAIGVLRKRPAVQGIE